MTFDALDTLIHYLSTNMVFQIEKKKQKQAGAELGQAQPELGLEDRVFMLWFKLRS